MIHSLELKGPAFHRVVEFKRGLNLVYGERRDATQTQGTCNSLGKSSLLWTIDFCLGAEPNMDPDPKSGLPALYLDAWEFTLDFDLGDRRIKATRSRNDAQTVYVDGDVSGFPIEPTLTIDPNAADQITRYGYEIEAWKLLLGAVFLSVPSGKLSFRELFGYFCRTRFVDPLYPVSASVKVNTLSRSLGYLLGLNWECVKTFTELAADGKDAKTVFDAAKIQLVDWQTTVTKLRKECREKAERLKKSREELDSFVVDPVYREKENAANMLTDEISRARRRLIVNRRSIAAAKNVAEAESVSVENVRRLYEEASVVFGGEVLRTLEETEAFHQSITANRQDVLKKEIRRLKEEIRADEKTAAEMDAQRAELLRHLSSCGALAEYTRLIETNAALGEELALKQKCLDDYSASKEKLAEVKESKARLHEELKADFENSGGAILEADQIFSSITSVLYNQPGNLGIRLRDTAKNIGYYFKPMHDGTGGTGIDKMMCFVFDLTILLRQMAQGRKIDFLLHDGELFTSADTRQRASALKLIHRWSLEKGFQYITGMNYDTYPDNDLREVIDREAITVLKLNDASDAGKLYGHTFNKRILRPDSNEPATLPPPAPHLHRDGL